MLKSLVILVSICASSLASAQEFGALVGVHQVEAESTGANSGKSDSKLNFKGGLAIQFDLGNQTHFRTGSIFTARNFEIVSAAGDETKVQFDYLDIPAGLQYGLNDKISIFGGLVVGVNLSDDIKYPATAASRPDPDAEKLISLLNLGVNLMFDDMIGFDFYMERGFGDVADNIENYSSYGANFLFWY